LTLNKTAKIIKKKPCSLSKDGARLFRLIARKQIKAYFATCNCKVAFKIQSIQLNINKIVSKKVVFTEICNFTV